MFISPSLIGQDLFAVPNGQYLTIRFSKQNDGHSTVYLQKGQGRSKNPLYHPDTVRGVVIDSVGPLSSDVPVDREQGFFCFFSCISRILDEANVDFLCGPLANTALIGFDLDLISLGIKGLYLLILLAADE